MRRRGGARRKHIYRDPTSTLENRPPWDHTAAFPYVGSVSLVDCFSLRLSFEVKRNA